MRPSPWQAAKPGSPRIFVLLPHDLHITLSKLRPYDYAAATPGRARGNLDLPPHAVAAGRLQLQASADLLGVRRRGDRTLRIVGRRLDDAGAAVALPALGNLGHRQRAADETARRPMVSAVALRTMARRQFII